MCNGAAKLPDDSDPCNTFMQTPTTGESAAASLEAGALELDDDRCALQAVCETRSKVQPDHKADVLTCLH